MFFRSFSGCLANQMPKCAIPSLFLAVYVQMSSVHFALPEITPIHTQLPPKDTLNFFVHLATFLPLSFFPFSCSFPNFSTFGHSFPFSSLPTIFHVLFTCLLANFFLSLSRSLFSLLFDPNLAPNDVILLVFRCIIGRQTHK